MGSLPALPNAGLFFFREGLDWLLPWPVSMPLLAVAFVDLEVVLEDAVLRLDFDRVLAEGSFDAVLAARVVEELMAVGVVA